jgi:hypothetical protein
MKLDLLLEAVRFLNSSANGLIILIDLGVELFKEVVIPRWLNPGSLWQLELLGLESSANTCVVHEQGGPHQI